MNRKWREDHQFHYGGFAVRKFLRLYRESLYNVKEKSNYRD
jgi:large subunit ribosomal protein L47